MLMCNTDYPSVTCVQPTLFLDIFISIYKRFHCDIPVSIFMYNVSWLGSFPPSFSLIIQLTFFFALEFGLTPQAC
jgi:hypothetical protein